MYLSAYSTQSGNLDSGHYVTHCLHYVNDTFKVVLLNDSCVSEGNYKPVYDETITTEAYWALYVD